MQLPLERPLQRARGLFVGDIVPVPDGHCQRHLKCGQEQDKSMWQMCT